LLTLVGRKNSNAREDASFLLGELKRTDGNADALLTHLNSEKDFVAQSAIIQALGKLGHPPTVQAMARLILSDKIDRDIRLDSADSLGRIVKIAFSESDDPLAAAISWLGTQGYSREGFQ
jgi:HEAT repeat protein